MVNSDTDIDIYRVVKSEPGSGTGDTNLTTADGRVWHAWDGQDRTGQEVHRFDN